MVVVMCLPLAELKDANAWFWGWGWGGFGAPNVLTNATVKFKDGDNTVIGDVDTGETFKLVITISGNNVYQNFGSNYTTYRVEITDSNLLLTNFKGNGFVDGAKYNGYTLRYDATTGKRWIEFKIRNGSTKTIQLNAKFANGVTEGGNAVSVKLVDVSTNRYVTGSITPNAEFKWVDNKTQNVNSLTTSDFEAGSIQYNLSATPDYVSDGTGELWATGLSFTDTIELSSGLTFKSADALKSALSIPGATIGDVTVDGNKAVVTWTVDSLNVDSTGKPYAEMDPYNVTATLSLNCISAASDFESGTISNTLDVKAKTYASDGKYTEELGTKSVSVPVTSNPAKFDQITKTIAAVESDTYANMGYFLEGDYVVFKVATKNTGGKAGSVTLTDTLPTGLTATASDVTSVTHDGAVTVSGNTITIVYNSVPAGEEASALIRCMVNGNASGSIGNTVKNDNGYSANSYITVKELTSEIDVTKTASVSSILKDTATES